MSDSFQDLHALICVDKLQRSGRAAHSGHRLRGQRALQAKMEKVGRGHMWWLVGCSGTLDNPHGNYNIIITINRSKRNINISKIQDQCVS